MSYSIPYLPTFGHVGATLEHLAPQIAAQYVHVAWEAINNAARKVKVKAILGGPTLRLAEKLAAEDAARSRAKPEVGVSEPAPQTWGSLGDHEFDLLSSPNHLEHTDGVVYARHALVGTKPRLQYTGDQLREIRLPISWHAMTTPDIEDRLEALHKSMRTREVLDLVIGEDSAGAFYSGDWVIERISHTVEKYRSDGRILSMEATLELVEWVKDPGLVVAPAGPAVKRKKNAAPSTAAKTKVDPLTGKIVKG